MRHRAFQNALFAACTLFVVTATASAHTYVWIGGVSSNWSNSLNWLSLTGSHYPGHNTNDIAIVSAPFLYHPRLDQNIAVDGLTIGNGAAVITFGHDLEITGTSSLAIHPNGDLYVSSGDALIISGATKAEIGGYIVLDDNSSLRFESSIYLCGWGSVPGVVCSDDEDNTIVIANGASVVSSLTFFGSMQFEADNPQSSTPATFDNCGLVFAANLGRIRMLPSVKLLDCGDGTRWRANNSTLIFHRSSDDSDADHPMLEGAFDIINCGEVWIEDGAQIATTSEFEHFSGTVRIWNGGYLGIGGTWVFTADYTTQDCEN